MDDIETSKTNDLLSTYVLWRVDRDEWFGSSIEVAHHVVWWMGNTLSLFLRHNKPQYI